ncbi:hypothetical protein Tco_0286878 [Tanacetum coccineum]
MRGGCGGGCGEGGEGVSRMRSRGVIERGLMVEEMACHLRKEVKIEVLTQIRKRRCSSVIFITRYVHKELSRWNDGLFNFIGRVRGGSLGGIHGKWKKSKDDDSEDDEDGEGEDYLIWMSVVGAIEEIVNFTDSEGEQGEIL